MWASCRALASRLYANGLGQPMQNTFGRPGRTEHKFVALGVRRVATNDWRCGLGWSHCKRLDATPWQTRLDYFFGVSILKSALIDGRGNGAIA